MTDDQGFGVAGTFGGVIPTPALDRIAKAGLRYTQFHSSALCSPTRAALITGRNHHSVGYGVIGELSTGYPGYNSTIGPQNATVGGILQENGYATSWFGKNHNTPGFQYSSAAGPFEQWPSGLGFQYFYGFMTGNVWQWTSDWYRPDYYQQLAAAGSVARNPQGPDAPFDPDEPAEPKRVHRGGSFLCTDQYCSRYIVGTRGKGEISTGTNHLGFRCVK